MPGVEDFIKRSILGRRIYSALTGQEVEPYVIPAFNRNAARISSERKNRNRSGSRVIAYSPVYNLNPKAPGIATIRRSGTLKYTDSIKKAEEKHGIPEGMLFKLLRTESNFNPKATSEKGAQGIAQLIPKFHPGVDPFNPEEAIPYAAGYLKENFNRFGSWRKALAAYNWGPTSLAKHGLEKAPKETRDYIKKILGDEDV